jgi:hypothetical protein
MEKILFALSKNGMEIFWDLETSHASTHFQDTPALKEVVRKAIPNFVVEGEGIQVEVDIGKVVGESSLIETTDHDDIVYALRPLRTLYSKFVKNRKPVATSWVTISIKHGEKGQYYLYTAYVGRLTPSFLGGDYLPEQSKGFWSHHALVWGTQEVIPESVTKECPWE